MNYFFTPKDNDNKMITRNNTRRIIKLINVSNNKHNLEQIDKNFNILLECQRVNDKNTINNVKSNNININNINGHE